MQWYDKASRMRIAGAPRLNYTLALFLGGEIRLGEHTYRAALCDTLGMGDFRGNAGSPASGILLVIDVNGNGAYDARGEAFDIAQPFTIQKVTYEVQGIAASGASFEIVKSSRSAPEIPPPPDLRPGKAIVPFVVKTMEGKTVRFPEDYKGKLVLLTFWASWCGDCKAELPNMVEAYTKYQQKGLAILGISLDQANHAPQLTAFLKANKMPWPQVYDGKFWSTPIAQLYGISWIPTSYLVDGDTGKILAEGDCLLGKNLIGTIQKDLAKKFPPT
jgi:thiol-disulfide isomerase/thioredoxin